MTQDEYNIFIDTLSKDISDKINDFIKPIYEYPEEEFIKISSNIINNIMFSVMILFFLHKNVDPLNKEKILSFYKCYFDTLIRSVEIMHGIKITYSMEEIKKH